MDSGMFLSERKARAGPLLEKFKAWLLKRKDEVLESSLLGKAVYYSLAPFKYQMAVFERVPLALTPEGWEKLLPWNIFKSQIFRYFLPRRDLYHRLN